MSNYTYDSIVSRSEAEALKDMIFKRVRARAEALNENTQNSYTTTIKSDVMELARDSFVANKNPFSILDNNKTGTNSTKPEETVNNQTEDNSIGLSERKQIKTQIHSKTQEFNNNIASATIESNMDDIRENLSQKSHFMGALDFLNSQASIALINKKGKSFEAVA